MGILSYLFIALYLIIGYSVYSYIIEGGDKKRVGLLWLFGWGVLRDICYSSNVNNPVC